MTLTSQTRLGKADDFPAVQLFLLAIVRLAEPIALTSIFPYAWALIKRFGIGSQDDASFYAGLLISSFSLAEALTGMFWGGLSDRIGRKPVLLLGCFGTMFSMVMLGFTSNIWMAVVGRVLGGLLNGNIAVIQTMVGELIKKPEHEPRAYSIMPFVWSIGTIIGPVLGGSFSDPHESFPTMFPAGSLFDRFPYLLPNLLCATLLLISILLGYFLLEETHPDLRSQGGDLPVSPEQADDCNYKTSLCLSTAFVSEETPLVETSDAIKRPAVDLRDDNYGTIKRFDRVVAATSTQTIGAGQEKHWPPTTGSIFSKRIMAVVVALAIFTYHSMTYDHLLPIFFEDGRAETMSVFVGSVGARSPFYSPGGLGLSLRTVGMVTAVNGAIALFIQAVVFPVMAERIGVYHLFLLVTLLHPVVYLLVPWLLIVPERLLFPAIYFCLTVRNFFGIITYPLLLILVKEATPSPNVLGKVNGLAASAGAFCRMAAPPVAGYLYSIGARADCTALAWYGSAVVAGLGAVQCFCVGRESRGEDALLRDQAVSATATDAAGTMGVVKPVPRVVASCFLDDAFSDETYSPGNSLVAARGRVDRAKNERPWLERA